MGDSQIQAQEWQRCCSARTLRAARLRRIHSKVLDGIPFPATASVDQLLTVVSQRSYAPDYLGLAILFTLYMLLIFFADPFHRMFSLDDLRISFPHAEHERVPPLWLFAYAIFTPAVVIAVWALAVQPGRHAVHVTYLGLLVALMIAAFTTEVLKNAVGRPRPDLIARCKPVSVRGTRDPLPQTSLP